MRATTLRADWQNVLTSCRNSLTSPAMIGTVAVAGAVVGVRRGAPARTVDCKCIKSSPSLLRVLLLASITPLLEHFVTRGLGYLVDPAATQKAGASSPNTDAATNADVTS